MKLLLYAYLVSCIGLISGVKTPEVSVQSGKIKNNNDDNCTYTVNGTEISTTKGNPDGLYFGLIHYKCEHGSGFILSIPECLDCGLYCPQNEIMLQCKPFLFPFIMGIFVSVMVFSLICFSGYKYGPITYKLINRRAVVLKNKKTKMKIKKIDSRINEVILKKEIDKKTQPTSPVYFELEDAVAKRNYKTINNRLNMPLPPTPSPRVYPDLKRSPSPARKLAACMTAGILMGSTGNLACDQTLFMKSSGQVCDSFSCKDINSYSFTIQYGSRVCFNTPEGNTMEFHITKPEFLYRYHLEYLASDYVIKHESFSRCKQAGECYSEHCYLGARHDSLPSNKSLIQYYDCNAEGLGCDTICWHQYSCTWSTWWLDVIGEPVKVYKLSQSLWTFDLIVTTKDGDRVYKFNSNNPVNIAEFSDLYTYGQLPISVTNAMHDTLHVDGYMIEDRGAFKEITASHKNLPISGMIGDLQISIDKKTMKMDYKSVDCRVISCKNECDYKEPSIRTIRKTSTAKKSFKVTRVDDYQIESRYSIGLTTQLTIGNVDFKNLFVEPARCDVSVDFSYGCIACNSLPYAVVSSSNIEKYGVMAFESNCTFAKSYVSCSSEPVVLNPVQRYDVCRLWFKNTNSTIHIGFDYEFVGELTRLDRTMSIDMTPIGIVGSIVSNPNFINGLLWSFSAFSGIAVLLGIISKIAARMIVFRKVSEVEEKV